MIKIGSAQLIEAATGAPRPQRFAALAADIASLRARGQDVVLVSSGAVALGRPRLGLGPRQKLSLEHKQAAAAAGQALLIHLWDQAFAGHGFPAAQALLSPADTEARPRWLNARNTLETLIRLGAVPVINENDTVATEELRFGDNDRLAARTAQLCAARLLIILSDVDGLYDRDPARPGAQHISDIPAITPAIEALAGPARSGAGTGGMASKIAAARIAMAAGCAVVITSGAAERPVEALRQGARASWFAAQGSPESARRAWIRGSLEPSGRLHLDAGAQRAVTAGRSLLPAGVAKVEGRFARGEAVRLIGPEGEAFATGIAGYDSEEARRIAGLRTGNAEAALGYRRGAALVHAGDIVLDGEDAS
ncbi:glutamate 5-kinase [Alkalicaulis satelles]|uniref:glutamate 5-kinase n=1 Tax=Alkalicaulis satelles TaxID=2609175 RepID=UPI0038CC1607